MKPKYKCTYTSRDGALCEIMVMKKYNQPHPRHCHAYDTTLWKINPKKTCRYCIQLKEGESPEKKIWCDEMSDCDSYHDGGIEKCHNCPAGIVVFDAPKIKRKSPTDPFVRTFDEIGYPTDETLDCVAALDPTKTNPDKIIEYLFSIWHWGESMGSYNQETGCFQISTGGWSGNESIITALEKSFFWILYWHQSRAGGHYWFTVKKIK